MSLKLYGPGFSYFLRAARLMLEIKELDYVITDSPRGAPIAYFSDAHTAFHPFRKLPFLIDGEHCIPETPAIAHYLEATKGGKTLFHADPIKSADIIAHTNMIFSYVHEALLKNMVFEFAFPKGDDNQIRFDVVEEAKPKGREALNWLAETIESAHYFKNDQFSLCDAYLIPMLDYQEQLPEQFNILQEYPTLLKYVEFDRIQPWTKGVLDKPELPIKLQ